MAKEINKRDLEMAKKCLECPVCKKDKKIPGVWLI